jgi:N-acetylneuraminate synthase
LEPAELKDLVEGCRTAWQALGRVHYEREASERANLRFRRSIYAVSEIAPGGLLTRNNVRVIRPGFGLPPKYLDAVLGQPAACAIARGTPLAWHMIGRK